MGCGNNLQMVPIKCRTGNTLKKYSSKACWQNKEEICTGCMPQISCWMENSERRCLYRESPKLVAKMKRIFKKGEHICKMEVYANLELGSKP